MTNTFARALALVVMGCSYQPATVQQMGDGGGILIDGARPNVSDASTSDTVLDDAGVDSVPDGAVDAAPPPKPRPASVTYPEGARHSPIDAAIATRLRAIVSGNAQEFAKVGDSITASTSFLDCFDGGAVDLGSHTDLSSTLDYFLGGNVGGSSPFGRYSQAAISGSTTQDIVSGSPSPLKRELAAIDPRYAVIMLGTNDIREARSYDAFGADLWSIVDQTIASGAIPILSTIPPNSQDSTADARVPMANRVIRAIAQGRRIPLVDYYREMVTLPSRGISSDGIHPSVAPSGACQLTSSSLQYGYNLRNLITLEALDRARAAASGTALDATVARPSGDGTAAAPYLVDGTFVDLNDNSDRAMQLTSYPCDARMQAGGEVVYRLDVSATTTLNVLVVDRGATDVDVHVLQGSLSASACTASADHQITKTVSPGTVYIVVDSPAEASAGEYLLVVQAQ